MNTNATHTPQLLTIPEAAAELRLTRSSVYRLIASGALPAVRIGGKGGSLRIDRDELEHAVYGEGTTR